MRIQLGKIYINKTVNYLLPILYSYGEEFKRKLHSVFKVAVGIGDSALIDTSVHYEKHLFLLLDTTCNTREFNKFLPWLRAQSYYEDDYSFDSLSGGYLHMIVIKYPHEYWNAMDYLRQGFYSKMYSREDIQKYFEDKEHSKLVLTKDSQYRVEFMEKVNKMFNSTVAPHEYLGELDFKPEKKHEYFHFVPVDKENTKEYPLPLLGKTITL